MSNKNDKYIRVEKEKPKNEQAPENEIRVTVVKGMRNYITYAISLFNNKEKVFDQIHLKAMGRAINKTVTIAEIIKRRVPNLHQNTSLESTEIIDKYEPLEEGLDTVEIKRRVSSITIILSKTPLDTKSPGYQPPISQDLVKPEEKGQGRIERRPYRGNRGFNRRGSRFRSRNYEGNFESYQGGSGERQGGFRRGGRGRGYYSGGGGGYQGGYGNFRDNRRGFRRGGRGGRGDSRGRFRGFRGRRPGFAQQGEGGPQGGQRRRGGRN